MMRCRWILPVVSAAVVCFANAFSFTPPPLKQCVRQDQPLVDDGDGAAEDEDYAHVRSRRGFFSKVAVTAPILLAASQASAVTNEPTRIELKVNTEYLIRVLEYFDGDMRKVLGVLIRSPETTVEIEPPAKGEKGLPSPKDAILRALYSYESPDEYITQASWVKVDEPDMGWVEFLTKERYRIYLPSVTSDGDDENGILDVTIVPTNINLSNLEVGGGLVVLSYPVAYAYYKYESWVEEQEMKARKAKIAAKNAAKAGAAKKTKGTPNKENIVVKAEEGKKPPALKGQAMKIDGQGEKPLPTKKATTANPKKDAVLESIKSIEDQVAAEMLDSQRANIAAATEQNKQQLERQDQVAAEMLDSQRANIAAATVQAEQQLEMQVVLQSNEVEGLAATIEQQWSQSGIEPEGDVNEMEQLIAAAAQLSRSTRSAPGGGYLDNLSEMFQIDTANPTRGPPTNYLDSL